MSVSSTTTKVSYSGDGSTVAFSYTFKIFAAADLEVIVRSSTGTETTKTLTTDYSVSGAGDEAGGTVTFVTAPVTGETVVIRRNLTLTQTTDYVENDPFPAESHEDALDRLTFITQGIQEELDRAIKASKTNTISSAEFTISAADRANKVFSFDGSGDLSVTQELGTYQGDWAASTAYAARDLVKDTSTNNIFICVTAHTSSGSQPLTTNTDSAKWALIVDAASATTSASAAATSATAAANSATAAATSATNAASSESNASTSATNAATSASSASTSATAAAASASAASTSETNAATSETNAGTSATSAATSATNAATSATAASTSASAASTSASAASTSATNAATSETNASNSASAASTSATNAATSETNAATSATAAAAAQAAAELAADNFDDTYLGAKASDPATDNDGDALTAGDLYFNTTSNELKVYNGSAWQVAAVSAAGLLAASNNLSDVASAATARSNLSAAASGANSDITSLTGLTTDLSVSQGGTGAGTFTANGVLYGNGTSALGVTATGTSGQVLTSNGSGSAPTFQDASAGSVVQVKSAFTDAYTTHANTNVDNPADILSVSITPTSASNKILVMGLFTGNSTNTSVQYLGVKLARGATEIGSGDATTRNGTEGELHSSASLAGDYSKPTGVSALFLDSPSTTSATTYKLQAFANHHGASLSNSTLVQNSGGYNYNNKEQGVGACSLIVMEVTP